MSTADLTLYVSPYELAQIQNRPLPAIWEEIKNNRLPYIKTEAGIRIPIHYRWDWKPAAPN